MKCQAQHLLWLVFCTVSRSVSQSLSQLLLSWSFSHPKTFENYKETRPEFDECTFSASYNVLEEMLLIKFLVTGKCNAVIYEYQYSNVIFLSVDSTS